MNGSTKRKKFSREPKTSFARFLTRTAITVLVIWGFIYLINEAMLFGVNKFGS